MIHYLTNEHHTKHSVTVDWGDDGMDMHNNFGHKSQQLCIFYHRDDEHDALEALRQIPKQKACSLAVRQMLHQQRGLNEDRQHICRNNTEAVVELPDKTRPVDLDYLKQHQIFV
jgi:hypothetical protein